MIRAQRRINLTGRRFNRLLVLGFSHSGVRSHSFWKCKCDCGTEKAIKGSHLLSKTTVSCGCFGKEQVKKACRIHGHSSRLHPNNSPTYRSWHSMMMRCFNPNLKDFKYWGGRGITVCQQWQTFSGFLADMGERPKGHTLDRYPDTDGNYEPGNCRWATFAAQVRNRQKISFVPVMPIAGMLSGVLSFGC